LDRRHRQAGGSSPFTSYVYEQDIDGVVKETIRN
jgi:hypothetical protein